MKDVSYSLPTKSLRAALAERGVPPPTDDDLVRLSGLFNEGLERARKLKNLEGFSFIMPFKEVDEDLSGYVTFDEFRRAVRDKIELKKAEFSDDELQALWCHLDRDDSNQILPEEMAPQTCAHRHQRRVGCGESQGLPGGTSRGTRRRRCSTSLTSPTRSRQARFGPPSRNVASPCQRMTI